MIQINLPERDVELVDIGPECFGAADGSVVSWRGRNYVPQDATFTSLATLPAEPEPEPYAVDQLLGFDVNAFTSVTVYGIFNDPDAPDLANVPEALREQVFEVPLYEDDTLERTLRHARLTNEDRAKLQPPRGPVIIKTWTILTSPKKILEDPRSVKE